MRHTILEQVARYAGTAKAIAIVEAEGPLKHFVLAHLRRKASVEIATPTKAFRKIVAPVNQFGHLHLVRLVRELVVNAMTRINRKQVIGQNLESKRRGNIGKL